MYNIETLAKLSGLPKRTIRYYIQIDLLTPPIGNCRGSYYTEAHLKRLDRVKNLSMQGVPLSQMKAIISSETESLDTTYDCEPCVSSWERLEIEDVIELNFRAKQLHPDDLKKIVLFIREVLQCRKESECD